MNKKYEIWGKRNKAAEVDIAAVRRGVKKQRGRTAHKDWKPAALPTPEECLAMAKKNGRTVETCWGKEVATGH